VIDHPQEDLAKFGWRSKRFFLFSFFFFQMVLYIGQHTRTHGLNIKNSKKNLKIWQLWAFFLMQKILCTNGIPDFFSCLSLMLKLVKPLTSNKQCWVGITYLKNLAILVLSIYIIVILIFNFFDILQGYQFFILLFTNWFLGSSYQSVI
jgi:hypothetical protein